MHMINSKDLVKTLLNSTRIFDILVINEGGISAPVNKKTERYTHELRNLWSEHS